MRRWVMAPFSALEALGLELASTMFYCCYSISLTFIKPCTFMCYLILLNVQIGQSSILQMWKLRLGEANTQPTILFLIKSRVRFHLSLFHSTSRAHASQLQPTALSILRAWGMEGRKWLKYCLLLEAMMLQLNPSSAPPPAPAVILTPCSSDLVHS